MLKVNVFFKFYRKIEEPGVRKTFYLSDIKHNLKFQIYLNKQLMSCLLGFWGVLLGFLSLLCFNLNLGPCEISQQHGNINLN